MAAAESIANTTLRLILNSDRAERIIEHHARDNNQPSLDDLLSQLLKHNITDRTLNKDDFKGEIYRMVQMTTLKYLLASLASEQTPGNVKAKVAFAVENVKKYSLQQLAKTSNPNFENANHLQMIKMISDFEQHPATFKLPESLPMPDGSPIGEEIFDF